MNKIRTALVGAALAAAAVVSVPMAAQAAENPAPGQVSAQAPDGNLHVYRGLNYTNYCAGFRGNSTNWGTCRNKAESLWNNGYPGSFDDVWVYYAPGYGGARRGVHNGVALSDLRNWTFDPNTGAGSGQWLWRNISSHKWTNL